MKFVRIRYGEGKEGCCKYIKIELVRTIEIIDFCNYKITYEEIENGRVVTATEMVNIDYIKIVDLDFVINEMDENGKDVI